MNTLEATSIPVRQTAPRRDALELLRPSPVGYIIGAVAALAIHAGILFAWPHGHTYERLEYGVEVGEESVEVDLVAALPAEEAVEVVEMPPEPELEPEPEPEVIPPPEPVVEPPPPVTPPEMTIPEPAPVQQPPPPEVKPKPKPKPKAPKPEAKPAVARPKVSGDGSSAIPGNDSTTQKRGVGGQSSKPSYLRNPHPAYPEEARNLRQEGVVLLRVSVSVDGRPSQVMLVRSSGYPLLDERALATVRDKWLFRPFRVDGNPVSGDAVIPIRFVLNN